MKSDVQELSDVQEMPMYRTYSAIFTRLEVQILEEHILGCAQCMLARRTL